MTWLGLDIGGANLKAADGRGWARSVPFPLWRDPGGLVTAIIALLADAPPTEGLAVTMTGELCDAFRSKAEGVRVILAAVQRAARARTVRVYLVNGQLVTIGEANECPDLASASNWHALAAFACRFIEGKFALLMDIGSTTTDIVPLVDGEPRPTGLNDVDRLLAGELVYTGVGRTPVCAITPALPWRGVQCPVAAELFATAADAYVTLGELAEQPTADWTADGRPLTKVFSRERLARMICADPPRFNDEDARDAAKAIYAAQKSVVRCGVDRVSAALPKPPEWVVLSGAGEFLANDVARSALPNSRVFSLHRHLGGGVSRVAPAHALAVLAAEAALYFPGRISGRNH